MTMNEPKEEKNTQEKKATWHEFHERTRRKKEKKGNKRSINIQRINSLVKKKSLSPSQKNLKCPCQLREMVAKMI